MFWLYGLQHAASQGGNCQCPEEFTGCVLKPPIIRGSWYPADTAGQDQPLSSIYSMLQVFHLHCMCCGLS